MNNPPRKIAVVHDFLYTYGGAERVLEQILNIYPEADLFSLFDFLPADQRDFIQNKPSTTTFIQKMPMAKKKHRAYLPLMPLAIEQLDVHGYDIVITSSYVAAKGVLTRPDQLHVCYCHSPVRYAWDLQHQYLAESGLSRGLRSMLARAILHYIRNWDARTANAVDVFVSNSRFVGNRIRKFYRREAITISPPVDVKGFELCTQKEDFYLTASRMVPYKRIDLIVEAFARMPDRKLVVIGDGPQMERIRAKAGPNVTLMGHQPFATLKDHMQKAKAFIFAAEEDFGIAPVEAQACGTPVIAFAKGGATETIIDHVTGVFFNQQSVDAIIRAVEDFEARPETWDPRVIRANAERFSAARFRDEFGQLVEHEWTKFHAAHLARPAVQFRTPDITMRIPPLADEDESAQEVVAANR